MYFRTFYLSGLERSVGPHWRGVRGLFLRQGRSTWHLSQVSDTGSPWAARSYLWNSYTLNCSCSWVTTVVWQLLMLGSTRYFHKAFALPYDCLQSILPPGSDSSFAFSVWSKKKREIRFLDGKTVRYLCSYRSGNSCWSTRSSSCYTWNEAPSHL
jgi:hypothetical protein